MFGIDFFDDAGQDAVLVEDEGAAEGPEDRLAVHFLLAPGAEGLEHFGGGVGEQAEGEFVPGAEAGMGFRAVLADPNDVVAGGGQRGVIVPETASLGGAAGGVVLRVEINNGLAADKVL